MAITALSLVTMENCEESLRPIRAYAEICTQLAIIGDADGFISSAEKLIDHARALRERLKILQHPEEVRARAMAKETLPDGVSGSGVQSPV